MSQAPANLEFRQAARADLPALIDLLADDELGAAREDSSRPLNPRYVEAFERIDTDPLNELIVVTREGDPVGMLQLTFIPCLARTGALRCLVEGVRIRRDHRGRGLGGDFFRWAVDRARERGCDLVQLTSDKRRPDALRFYESLGFTASHEGFKLEL